MTGEPKKLVTIPDSDHYDVYKFVNPDVFEIVMRAIFGISDTSGLERLRAALTSMLDWTTKPSRLVVLAAGMFFLNIFTAPTQQLQTDYLRNTRGLSSTAVAVFILATNTWGFIGIFAGAKLADRSSRRRAATIGLLGLAIGNTAMFCIGGPPMWVASLVGSMVGAAVVPSLGALLPELFPTLRRGAANGLLNGAAVIGSMTGLYVVGQVVTDGTYGPTVAALALGPLIVAGLVWRLPETAGIELEALNPDD